MSEPPIPIAATLAFATGAWSCTFDRPLEGGALDFTNWSLNATDTVFVPSSATAAGAVVSGASTAGFANPSADIVGYSPPPFDVIGTNARLAAVFANFPLVVT